MFTITNRPIGAGDPTGNGLEPKFSYVYSKKGRQLKRTGEFENTYEKIQSQLAETKIENIIARYRSGDTSILNTEKVYIMDSLMPGSFEEQQNRVLAIKQQFSALPAELKQKFNNNVYEFAEEYGSEKFKEKLGLIQKPLEYQGKPIEAAKPIETEKEGEK